MFTFCTILKNPNSLERFQLEYEDKDIRWNNVLNLEELQEEIAIKFDLVIVDQRIWWFEECKELLKLQNSKVILFNADFGRIFEQVNEELEKMEESEAKEKKKLLEEQSKNNNVQEKTKVIVKEVVKEVERVVYKSKDIRRNVFTVITDDNVPVRDYYALNLGAALTSLKNEKSVVIDITFSQNIINYISVTKERKRKVTKDINGATILECMDSLEAKNVSLLRLDEMNISKNLLKKILFTLRDYENIIFVVDRTNEKIPVSYILTLAHSIHLILEPTYPTIKNSFNIVESLKEMGQVNENIKIVFSDEEIDKEVVENLYKNQYETYYFKKNNLLNSINEDDFFNGKIKKVLYEILGIKTKNRFWKLGRE